MTLNALPKSIVYKDFDKIYKCEITDDEDWDPNADEKKVNTTPNAFLKSKVRRIRKDGYR